MRYREFNRLIEGYPQAQAAFVQQSMTGPEAVQKTIANFRQLVARNQITDINQKNIDWWIGQGWEKFSAFVNQAVTVPSKTQIVRKKLVGESIRLVDNAEWLMVIPVDKAASCFHGKDSEWCTTKVHQSHFEKYFYQDSITLIYCFKKATGNMWAITIDRKYDEVELFDRMDVVLSPEKFTAQTGLDPQQVIDLIDPSEHGPVIKASRDKWHASVALTTQLLKGMPWGVRSPRNADIERELLYNRHQDLCVRYIVLLGSIESRDFPLGIQLSAISNPDIFHKILNPVMAVQLAVVKISEKGLPWLIRLKIPLTPAVQLAAYKTDWHAASIMHRAGIQICEELQIYMYEQFDYDVEQIIEMSGVPSERVQVAWIKLRKRVLSELIELGIQPAESAQLIAAQDPDSRYAFISLIREGLVPPESVQMVLVQNEVIRYLLEMGIPLSQRVQLAAVEHDRNALFEITKVGIEPTEAVQLASVTKFWNSYQYITRAGITPSAAVTRAYRKGLEQYKASRESKELKEETLEELIGIKNIIKQLPEPHYFDPWSDSWDEDEEDREIVKPMGQEWHDIMEQHGFHVLGVGAYGTVWGHEKLPYALKVFRSYDEAYRGWVQTCLKPENKNNPHLPKFISPRIVPITSEVYAIRMEKLSPVPENLKGIVHSTYFVLHNETDRMSRKETNLFNRFCKANPQWMNALDILRKFQHGTEFSFDIHAKNIMARGQTLVITDPVEDSSGRTSWGF